MKIGIDTFACEGGASAVGEYLSQFLRRLPSSETFSEDKFELFGWDIDRFAYSDSAPDMDFVARCRINGNTANALWHLMKYPNFARERGYGACFFPAAHRRVPPRSPCPSIGTVHDMGAYWGGRSTREHLGAVIRMGLPSALRHLDRIIAVSQWVKQELVEIVKVKESRITVVPDGIDHHSFYPRPRNEESVLLIQPVSFRRPYILYVARLDHPVKNHIKLIEAFGIFKERTHYPHRLVLAGADSNGADKIKAAAATSKYRNDIFFTGPFPTKSLPELYAGSDMAVIPSRYEGFGMGVLEAMASGVPAACARAASLPETAEHAALYFDPLDAEDMADRMVTITSDRAVYDRCRNMGLQRAAAFSWDECARRTLEIIRETAGS
jgi:glycosyltransferase involved in cell wall biosynthesis